MIDITSVTDGDLRILDVQTCKAQNLFQVQIGALEYAPLFGIDLSFFIDPDLQFQNESFKSYLIQRLSENHINVNQVIESLTRFSENLSFVVGENDRVSGGFIK